MRMSEMTGSEAIAFVGGGNMTRSLVGGLIARGVPSGRISVSEPQEALRNGLASDFGVRVFSDNDNAVAAAPLVLLAVKPQMMRAVCEQLAGRVDDAVVVSIAAGITCRQLQRWLGAARDVVRCMPNTPALIGAGAIGLYAKPTTSEASRAAVERVLSAAGVCAWVPEEAQIDAVTALSGSGPAYAFLLAEAMQHAAVQLGLSQEVAGALTR
ncbi:Pyrroline-5-carboxylate reductase [plant metagenome]|uniref:Pyrroline-5-carboxylate reductase n=1 Tax=plant metagenome TaxID=1297885 RepID=A0A484SF40_9ZZZZ